jgi:hypothetical protein
MKQRFQHFNTDARLQAVRAQNNQMILHLVAKGLPQLQVISDRNHIAASRIEDCSGQITIHKSGIPFRKERSVVLVVTGISISTKVLDDELMV